MKEWKRVTCCPYCGGDLEVSYYYTFSFDYRITKAGILSKRFKKSDPGEMNCMTGYCYGCGRAFDDNEITVEHDGTVWMKVEKGEDDEP